MNPDTQALIAASTGISLSDTGAIYNRPGLPVIVVETQLCRAVIALQGAHILAFERKSAEDGNATPLLWLSPNAIFTPGKAIRGGIPFCFPWFGPHSQNANAPQHGFARILDWQLHTISETANATELTFSLTSDAETLTLYPHAFGAELHFTLNRSLTIELNVMNRGAHSMPVGWALHSYFPVSDTATTIIPELVGSDYLDQTDNRRNKTLSGNLDFSQHTDAVFLQSPDRITLIRPDGSLEISCENAPTTIVWNPSDLANTVPDLGIGTQSQFVCVERGVAFSDCWEIPAGESAHARMRISE